MNYEYFRYPRTTIKPFFFKHRGNLYSVSKKTHPSKIEDNVNKSKAVFSYFKNLLFGLPNERVNRQIIFEPELPI